VRTFLSAILLIVAALLTFPATLAVWEQRVLMDEAQFQQLGNEVLAKENVQTALATRISDEVQRYEPRLQGPIVDAAAESIVQRLPDSPPGDLALQTSHELLVRLVRGERLEAEDDRIILDLRPTVDEVISQIPRQIFDADVQLDEDAGRITLVAEEDLSLPFRLARWFDGAALYIAIAPAVVFLIAVVIASHRRTALALGGALIAVSAILRIVLMQTVIRDALLDAAIIDTSSRAAAVDVYDALTASLISQDVIFIAAGAILAGFGLVAGAFHAHEH